MSLPRTNTFRRRSSVIEIHSTGSVSSLEDDKTKLLLAAKTPNMISKRRGSAVSIETLQSNSRRNSIATIDSSTIITTTCTIPSATNSSDFNNSYQTSTTTITTHTTQISLPMDTDDPVVFNSLPSSSSPFSLEGEEDDMFPVEDFHFTSNDHLPTHNRTFSQFSRSAPRHQTIGKNAYVNSNSGSKYDGSLPGATHSRSLSQPIPSFSPQRPLIPSANYDHHNLYKKRTKLSSRKLMNFFGDKPPLDICVKEIEKEGLKAMLHSKIPLCYFLYSLLEEYSCENLFFFLEVEQYESSDYAHSSQQYATAQHIYDTYLTRNSQFEVNVDDKVRKSVVASIKSQRDPRHCFDEAKRAIFLLLECSFARFIRSDIADIMKQEIGETTTHYSPKARDSAIFLLFKFLNRQNQSNSSTPTHPPLRSKSSIISHYNKEKDHSSRLVPSPPTSPIPSSTSSISQKRHELIRTMIYEFIRTLLEIDINNYSGRGRKFKNHFSKHINHHYHRNRHNHTNDEMYNDVNEFNGNTGEVDEDDIGGRMPMTEDVTWESDYVSMLGANGVFITGLGLSLSEVEEKNTSTHDSLIDKTMSLAMNENTSTSTSTNTPVIRHRKSVKELKNPFGKRKS
ncbi:9839_t:CDS:2 [Acaulospora morrowiae]|uniref:9839_t:CDS:1 n=1 Tax=Acaulospora morrowiae TaxID=94023 RepID=A0A9N8VVD1_9GLOM|nr:9839_t:CDS:2 [Acaulospora morrowiae]